MKFDKLISILFCVFIFGFLIANTITPPKAFSETENRNLEKKPKFSAKALFSGEFTKNYEKFITDQFILRDQFVSLKSYSERLLGKQENNGIYITKDGSLIGKFENPDMERVLKNAQAVENFAKAVDIPVYSTIIPTSAHIWDYKLPKNAPNYNQKALMNLIKKEWEKTIYIDSFKALENHRNEDIFYKTDHHWTSLGAFYGYENVAKSMGITPITLDKTNEKVITDSFYGTFHSKSGVRYISPDKISTLLNPENLNIGIFDGETPKNGSLYDESFLDKKDKYSFFLGGNHPLVKLSTDNGDKKLLIIKDSYSNSQVPFWTQHYQQIFIIDLRLNKSSIKEFIKENEIDEVLIQYSLSNFTTDNNLIFLPR